MRSITRLIANSCVALLIAGPVMAGPLTGPTDPTQPITQPPTKPAMPGMPSVEPIMIESRLGFMIMTPIIAYNNTGVLNYTVADGLLSVNADPLAILLNSIDPPSLIFPGALGADFRINIIVAPDGSLVGGVPGDDLVITGAVDLNGDFIPDIDGVLLTAEVADYMGEDSGGSTDFHAFRFTVTGGFLAGPFGSDIGVEMTSETSTFTGDYTVDFSGEAKGNIGVVECTGTIGDFVWLDTNGDGIQDDGEPGIGGVQLILTDQFGAMTTATTFPDGSYQFGGLCAGTYTVSVNPASLPPDVDPTLIGAPGSNDENDSNDPAGTEVTLPNNDSMDQDTDFGYVPLTSALGDYVWEDLNMDGIQDSNEPPVEGVMVNLYDCAGGFIATMTTDEFGFYQFTNLASGCYQVEFILPDGFVFTLQNQNGEALDSDPDPTTGFTDPVNLGSGETNPDVDAGIFRPLEAELGDRFWEDLNGNGIQDMGEPGIEGVTVSLFDCAGNFLTSTTTGANGNYLFPGLDGGCYIVAFDPPANCTLTGMNAGLDDTADSDADPVNGVAGPITLADGQSDLTWDAGCYYPAGLGDFVWNDLDQDGIQDSGEPGIEGLTVVLLDANMGPTGLTTTTGPNGEYEFTGLAPGSYFVQFASPVGFVYSPQDTGSNTNDTVDSDANGTGKTDKIILESGEFDPTIDAGVYEPNDPNISIEKSTNGADADFPTGPFVPNGEPVLWEYVVTNTGNVTLTDIIVFDDQGVAVDCPETTLIPGDFMTCTGNGSATADQYENLGTTCGVDSNGTEVCDDDPSHYFGANPDIDIEKATNGEDADTPTGPYITPGASVTWSYVVENTGNVTLSDVTVTDDQGVTVSCPLDTLDPGQIMTCSADGTAVAGQYANIGSVIGTPPEGAGDPVDDEDPSHYFGALPGIDIEKATNGEDADDPTGPFISVGGAVNWTYVVTNTGNVPLTNVIVTDSQGVSVSCPTDTLAPAGEPGDSFICTASGTAIAGQYANVGDVVGTPPEGPNQTDEDPSHYFGANPSIDIEKATNGEDADTPTGPVVVIGSTVNWTYVVENTGNVDLTNVMVADNQGVTVTCPATTLAVGDSFICTASGIATAGQYANIGTVSGTPPVGDPVNDMDPSHYFGADPSIEIEKATNGVDADDPNAGDAPQLAPGDTVTWTYLVTNTGNVLLSNVNVTDDQGVSVSCPQDTLQPDAFMTCTATGVADDLGNTSSTTVPGLCGNIPNSPMYENRGMASGETAAGEFVEDDDLSHYCNTVVLCDIGLDKKCRTVEAMLPGDSCETKLSALLVRYIGPSAPDSTVLFEGKAGATALYTGVDLISGETVLDAQNDYSIDAASTGLIDLGAKTSIYINGVEESIHTSCSIPVTVGLPAPLNSGAPSPNWLVLGFRDRDGNVVMSDDIPGEFTDNCTVTAAGDTVEFTYEVTNLGTTTVTNVTVTDSVLGTIPGSPIAMIAPGSSETLLTEHFVGVATVMQATATGFSTSGSQCVAQDTLTVTVDGDMPTGGTEGCTPGYWKQSQHFDSWNGFNPDDDYESVMNVDEPAALTLLAALRRGGDSENALGRHAVAALLNTSNSAVDYGFTTAQIIALVQSAYQTGDFETAKNTLETANERGCPLN